MATYKVTLISEEHDINTTIDCNDDVFVLDEYFLSALKPNLIGYFFLSISIKV